MSVTATNRLVAGKGGENTRMPASVTKLMAKNDAQRIKEAGGLVDIGPECFGLADGSVLSWRGQNYTPQRTSPRAWLHNLIVRHLPARRPADRPRQHI